jgi:hypothetical protein
VDRTHKKKGKKIQRGREKNALPVKIKEAHSLENLGTQRHSLLPLTL